MKGKLWQAIVALACAGMLSGCVVALGNKVPENQKDAKGHPTLGRQLTDLKQARDSGAINEEEYQTAKKRLLTSEQPKHDAHAH
jgi:hypothetical protein